MIESKTVDIKIRPAKLEDSKSMAELQKEHTKQLKVLEIPKSEEKIRLAIGSSFLNKNSYFVVEDDGDLIGFIEQKKHNNSHVMISYPFVALHHPNRREIQHQLIETILSKLQKYGYQHVSAQVSKVRNEGENLFRSAGFDEEQTVFQAFRGKISPLTDIPSKGIMYKRVKPKHLDITYRWIKRQLNPMSPINISREYFERLLHAPKDVRDGWSIAYDEESENPLGFVSSMIDEQSGDVIVFGPFNAPENEDIRIPLLNELLWYHTLQGRDTIRLMRIDLFDNDQELITKFGLEQVEEVKILTNHLLD